MSSLPTFDKWYQAALPAIKPHSSALLAGTVVTLAGWIVLEYLFEKLKLNFGVLILAYYPGVLLLAFCFARPEVGPGRFPYIRSGIVPVIPVILGEAIAGIITVLGYSPYDRPATPEAIPGTIFALIMFTLPLPFIAGMGAFLRNEYRILFKR